MNRSRITGDLVSQNNIFVNTANDRVGIGSTIPTNKLDVRGIIESRSATNFHESLWSGENTKIQLQAGYLHIQGGSNGTIFRRLNGGNCFHITSAGHLITALDSTFDIGTNSTRIRNIYADNLYGDGSNLTALNIVTDTSPQLGGDLDVNGKKIKFPDLTGSVNNILYFGTGDDLLIYHHADINYIQCENARTLRIQQWTGSANETLANFIPNGAVELYHNNVKKFDTTAYGINVTGTTDTDGLVVSGVTTTSGNVNVTGNITATGTLDTGNATINRVDVTVVTDGSRNNGAFIEPGDTGQGNRPKVRLKGAGNQGLSQEAIQVFYDNGSTKSFELDYQGNIEARDLDVRHADFSAGIGVTGGITNIVSSHNTAMLTLTANMGSNNNRSLIISSPVTDSTHNPFRFQTSNAFEFQVDAARTLFIHESGRIDLHHDGSTDAKLSTSSTGINISGDLTLTDTTADSAAGPEFKLFRNSASPADADYLGQIKFAGESDTGVERNYAKITGKILDASNGTEDGILEFAHIKAGSQTITGRWRSDSLQLLNSTNFSVAGTSEFTGDATFNGGAGAVTVAAASDIRIAGGTWTGEYTGGIKIQSDGSNSYIQHKGTLFFRDEGAANNFQLNQSGNLIITGSVTANGGFSGSGASLTSVNAATLANVSIGSLVRSDAEDTITAPLNINGGTANGANDATLFVTATNNNDWGLIVNKNNSGSSEYGADIRVGSSANYGLRVLGGSSDVFRVTGAGNVYIGGSNIVWHAGNDGSGSGLDADTLDGHQATAFLRSDTTDAQTSGSMTFGRGSVDPDSFTASSGGFGGISDGSGWGATGLFVHGGGTGDAAAMAHNGSALYFGIQDGANANSMETWLQVTPGSRIINFSSDNNNTNVQIGGNKIFHTGNDGSGSGFDADTVDGLNAASFLRSDQNDSTSGFLNVQVLRFNGVGGNSNNAAPPDSYAIYQAGGSWSHPYPDLVIGYHTGIKIGALGSYGGTRFYSDAPERSGATEIFSVGNGDSNTRVNNQLFVSGTSRNRFTGSTSFGAGGVGFTLSANGTYHSHTVGHNASQHAGIFWHTNGNYGIYRTAGNWSGNYSQLRLDWPTGIIIDGGTGNPFSGVHIEGHLLPISNNAFDLGTSSLRWRNLYTNDLNLSNEGGTNDVDGTWGSYTIQEGENDLFLINKRSGKKYKFNLTEVS